VPKRGIANTNLLWRVGVEYDAHGNKMMLPAEKTLRRYGDDGVANINLVQVFGITQ